MGNDFISYRLQRANETILEVKILIDNKLWNTAINRMYYACFGTRLIFLNRLKVEFF
jgi:uncharacterized protein (UPF0332 family)